MSPVRWSWDPYEVGSVQPVCGMSRSPKGQTPLCDQQSVNLVLKVFASGQTSNMHSLKIFFYLELSAP